MGPIQLASIMSLVVINAKDRYSKIRFTFSHARSQIARCNAPVESSAITKASVQPMALVVPHFSYCQKMIELFPDDGER